MKLQQRTDLMQGYILAPEGACVSDAIRTADISIPSYRESLMATGNIILTQYNSNSRAAELQTEPPTPEICQRAIDEIAQRREAALEEFRGLLAEAKVEMKDAGGSRERGFWRSRLRSIEAKIQVVIDEEAVTADDLHKALMREDIQIRAKNVPPEMREAMEAVERERQLASLG